MLATVDNIAAELGPQKFDWWKDWRGKAVAVIASGPSVRKGEVELLKGRLPVLAIKKNVELAPWADVVYGCDGPWWQSVRGLPDFKGLKLSYTDRVCKDFGLKKIGIDHPKSNELKLSDPGDVGAGGNSGFQALNIAVQFGAKAILLIGFDMQGRSGIHWYGRNNWMGANNPTDDNYRRWQKAFNGAAPVLEKMGVEVVNAAPHSALTCFPKASVEATLNRWGL